MNRGESRWYTFRVPDKRRPVLLLSRTEVLDQLNEVIVAPVGLFVGSPPRLF